VIRKKINFCVSSGWFPVYVYFKLSVSSCYCQIEKVCQQNIKIKFGIQENLHSSLRVQWWSTADSDTMQSSVRPSVQPSACPFIHSFMYCFVRLFSCLHVCTYSLCNYAISMSSLWKT